jgi:hypothetical protein
MIAQEILLYFAVLVLTVAAPYYAVLGLVLLAPWNVLNDAIGWDPRLGWACIIATRAAYGAWKSQTYKIPRSALFTGAAFCALAFTEIQFGTRNLTGDDVDASKSTLLYFVGGALASFAIIQLSDSFARLRALLICATASILFALGFGLLQASASYASGMPSDRIPGTIGNPNYFAAFLGLGATCATVFWRSKWIVPKLFLLAAVLASIVCVVTLSRMGTVACIIGVSTALTIKESGKLFNFKMVLWIAVFAVLGSGLAFGYLSSVRQSITYSNDPINARNAELTQEVEDYTRLEAAEFSLSQLLKNPILGVGLNTIAARNYIQSGLYVTSHDTYLQILAGTGLCGGLLLLFASIHCIRILPAPRRRLLLPALAQLALCSFFGDYLQSIDLIVLFSVLFVAARDLPLTQLTAPPAEQTCVA